MENKDFSFAERTALMRQTAFELKTAAETVLAEVQRMEAAAERFAARGKTRGTRASDAS
jgi:hypothetical protein